MYKVKISLLALLILLLIPALSTAGFNTGAVNGWTIATSCSSITTAGKGCYDTVLHTFCIGNGSSCAPIGSAGSVATDTIWDAKGDLAVGTGANTSARVAAGEDYSIPYYKAAETAGITHLAPVNNSIVGYNSSGVLGAYTSIQIDDSGPQFYSATAGKGELKFDQTGISDTKILTLKWTAADNYTFTPTITGNTIVTFPTSGTLQTVKAEKLAVFSIPGESADNTVVDSYIPVASTITGVLITTTGSACSAVVDLWVDTYANFPATNADTITSATPPTLATAVKNKDTTLTSWTTAIPADSVMRANLDSSDCTGIIQVTVFGTK